MRVYENGLYRELTLEEIAKNQKAEAIYKAEERNRPLSESEVFSLFLPQKVQEIEVDNNTALRMMPYYPTFEDSVGRTVKKGFKFTHGDKLRSVIQPEMTIQKHYPPGVGTESLYVEICENHDGTFDDPIPYSGNMALKKDKYYIQDREIYLCVRDTVNPVYHALSELVGQFVEIA